MSATRLVQQTVQKRARRRALLKAIGLSALAGTYPLSVVKAANAEPRSVALGSGKVHILSDGHLRFAVKDVVNPATNLSEAIELLSNSNLPTDFVTPPCNVTLWQTDNQLVLIDTGSGTQFVDTVGMLPLQLESVGIDPADITDVLFTHAHPDHCWGILDDFDELLCPNATYHIHGTEYDYWMSESTLSAAPESMLGMVVGARNRLPLIQPQLKRFNWGDEVVAGIEAIDTHGHTPGHTSFAIHSGSQSLLIVGDALVHPVLSFQRPKWQWPTDANGQDAVETRVKLLERLSSEKMNLVAYHLPESGYGQVDVTNSNYRFVSG